MFDNLKQHQGLDSILLVLLNFLGKNWKHKTQVFYDQIVHISKNISKTKWR